MEKTEAQHTPEPWSFKPLTTKLDEEEICGFIIAEPENSDLPSAAIAAVRYQEHDGNDVSQANARRIVACVNACEGIPTEALEMTGSSKVMASVIDLAQEALESGVLMELLGALESVTEVAENMREKLEQVGGYEIPNAPFNRAYCAIAKAEGKS